MSARDGRLDVLAHELRSPVAALGAVAAAVGETRGDERRELVRLCLAACSAITRLVTDMTIASARSAVVDLADIARDAARARVLAGDRVDVQADPALPAVAGDPVRLRQALDNVLTNAVVHASGPGAIAVTVRRTGAGVAVSVSDDGPGIPESDLDRIFDPGVRLDLSRTGTGLGLAITKAIVEAHQGSLTVESSPGRGATFTITLPEADAHPDT